METKKLEEMCLVNNMVENKNFSVGFYLKAHSKTLKKTGHTIQARELIPELPYSRGTESYMLKCLYSRLYVIAELMKIQNTTGLHLKKASYCKTNFKSDNNICGILQKSFHWN